MPCHASHQKNPLKTMLNVDDARDIAKRWRERFSDEAAFELSWSRYFDTATVPDAQRLEAWLAKDLVKDEVRHAGIVKEPVLPTRSRHQLSDCDHCGGLRYFVRRGTDITIDHPDFGVAHPCPSCNRR